MSLAIPESQRAEDYPKDMRGEVVIAHDADLGPRSWRLWTSQGATASRKFVIGDLPEIIEDEIDGDPVAVRVKLPVTINGRIFPRGNIDLWSFEDVSSRAAEILSRLRDGSMPCDGAWPEAKIELFQRWASTGLQP